VQLGGLLHQRNDAECNVIYFGGWSPGRKEGGAPFWPMLRERKCNFLLLDARGHGDSKGSFMWSFLTYGSEYKDLIGAITYMNTVSNGKPIFLLGVCAGAFHAIHAVNNWQINNRPQQKQTKNQVHTDHNVKGIIFDSGWPSFMIASRTVSLAQVNCVLLSIILWLMRVPKNERKKIKISPLYRICSKVLGVVITTLHTIIIHPIYFFREKKTNLFDKIAKVTVPILVVHAKNDEHVPYKSVQQLFKNFVSKTEFIVEDCKHSCVNLKYFERYKKALDTFIDDVLANRLKVNRV